MLLGGCATYRPAPLPDTDAVLDATVAERVDGWHEHPLVPTRPIDLDQPLSDLDVARLALVASPDLAAARARIGVSDAQLFSAGLVPDPQLSLSLEHGSAMGIVNGLVAGLAFDLASLFTRADRIAGAQGTAEQTHLDVAWTEWLALNQVRTLVRRILSLQRQVDVALHAADATAAGYALAEDNMRAGDARLDDVGVYQIGHLDAQDRLLGLVRQATAARQELNALVGVPPDAVLTLANDHTLRPLDALDADTLVRRAARERLDLRALEAGYSAAEHDTRAATRAALPLPQLTLARARDTGAVWTSTLGLDATLPLWNRNRGAISVAEATREQLRAEYSARVLATRADIAAQLADLRALDTQRRALAEQLPALEASTLTIGDAVHDGGVPLLTFETVRAALLDRQLALLGLEQAQAEGEIALETAAGTLLWTTP